MKEHKKCLHWFNLYILKLNEFLTKNRFRCINTGKEPSNV